MTTEVNVKTEKVAEGNSRLVNKFERKQTKALNIFHKALNQLKKVSSKIDHSINKHQITIDDRAFDNDCDGKTIEALGQKRESVLKQVEKINEILKV